MSEAQIPPLLVGLLVDVSGSMTSAIENRGGKSMTRLEGFRDALDGASVFPHHQMIGIAA